jgi:hypothetical protein
MNPIIRTMNEGEILDIQEGEAITISHRTYIKEGNNLYGLGFSGSSQQINDDILTFDDRGSKIIPRTPHIEGCILDPGLKRIGESLFPLSFYRMGLFLKRICQEYQELDEYIYAKYSIICIKVIKNHNNSISKSSIISIFLVYFDIFNK